LATFLIAEFGFLGVVVYTLVQTPRRCGHESKAADLLLLVGFVRPFLTNCEIVGILSPLYFTNFTYENLLFPILGTAKIEK
jgi:hypothetical protein